MRYTLYVLAVLDHLLRLVISFTLAMPIGWNRERSERSAGIRTFTIVSLASCGFVLATQQISTSAEAQTRTLQGLLAGIGFIGSGAIIRRGSRTLGTATAASIWATAAIGVSTALAQYDIAVILSAATFVILRWLAPVDANTRRREPTR